jgi:hypothetical protein
MTVGGEAGEKYPLASCLVKEPGMFWLTTIVPEVIRSSYNRVLWGMRVTTLPRPPFVPVLKVVKFKVFNWPQIM